MPFARALLGAALASLACTPTAAAGDATILGRALVVAGTPDADESARTVKMTAHESSSDLATIADPRIGGATLTLVIAGAASSSQSFALAAGRWTAVPNGYQYRMAKTAFGPPVRRVTVTVEPGGVAKMQLVLRGDTGTDPLLAVPPDSGTEGGITLAIGSERYCVRFGGAAGGTTRSDTATRWRIVRPLTEAGCLEPPAPACGNGTVESEEWCDGSASPFCDALGFGSHAVCGEPNGAFACGCCYPPGTQYEDVFGTDGWCCDGEELPVAPYVNYCGSCFPDGFHCLFGPSTCCSGTCVETDDLPVCGSGS